MARTAVLGWGSLIWCPQNLHIIGEWFRDGPYLPIEFARVSKDKRLTLVLFPSAEKVKVLWTYMNRGLDLGEAIENLRERERTTGERIGFLEVSCRRERCNVVPEVIGDIERWAHEKSVDAVIWTDLPSNFEERTRIKFTEQNVVKYLENLQEAEKRRAEEYIRRAPRQIRTKMRRVIEERLGWTYGGNNT